MRFMLIICLAMLSVLARGQNVNRRFDLTKYAAVFAWKEGCQTPREALKATGGVFAINGGYYWPLEKTGRNLPNVIDLLVINKKPVTPYRKDLARPVFASDPRTRKVAIYRNLSQCPDPGLYAFLHAGDRTPQYPTKRFWRVIVGITDNGRYLRVIRRQLNQEECNALVRKYKFGKNYLFFDGDSDSVPRTWVPVHLVMVRVV